MDKATAIAAVIPSEIMPYKDRAAQTNYQSKWMQERREAWLLKYGPCVLCGSWDNLEVDHIDRTIKVDHRVWSWSEQRRSEELSKCQVLCHSCHRAKTNIECYPNTHRNGVAIGAHGTTTNYRRGCRCAECTLAKSCYKKMYRLGKNGVTAPLIQWGQ